MGGILDHVWGVSAGADRVWAQVSGLAPRAAGARLLLALQAFIDDSYDPDGTFVLGGHIASAANWAQFSRDWEELLPLAAKDKQGRHRFKMKEMAGSDERMGNVESFYRVLEKYVLVSLSCKIDRRELRLARNRIWVPGLSIDWGFLNSPYKVAFRCLLEMFHNHRDRIQSFIPPDDKIDFFFDRQTESKAILSAWDDYVANRDDGIRHRFGTFPRFER